MRLNSGLKQAEPPIQRRRRRKNTSIQFLICLVSLWDASNRFIFKFNLDTALVLTSDNFVLNFLHPFLSRNSLVAPFKNSLMTPFCRVFTYIHSFLTEKDVCGGQNISNKFPYVCVYVSSGDLSIFGKKFPFPFPYFLLIN